MATAFSHAYVALAGGRGVMLSWRIVIVGALCAAAPDLDAIGFFLGVPYESQWGHRGFTHALLFAAVAGPLVALVVARAQRVKLAIYFAACFASHGMLDALTSGGLGVAFFWPLSSQRWFFAWRPIRVSPLNPAQFLHGRAWAVLVSECIVVWLPVSALWLVARVVQRLRATANVKRD